MSWLICIGGGIASGKTTLAKALKEALPDSVRLAFGDVVRLRALAEGREPTRQNLQDAGLRLIAEGWPAFVNDLLRHFKNDPEVLIVEGIRHREAVDVLHERLPMRQLLLVYLEVGGDQRRKRLAQIGEAERILNHDVERAVSALRTTADLVLSTDQSTDELVRLVHQLVEERNRQP